MLISESEYLLQLIVAFSAVVEASYGNDYDGYGFGKREAAVPMTRYRYSRKHGYGFRSYGYGKRETVAPDSYAVEKRKAELAAIAAFGGVALRCNGFWWLQSRLPSLATGTRMQRLPC